MDFISFFFLHSYDIFVDEARSSSLVSEVKSRIHTFSTVPGLEQSQFASVAVISVCFF